MMENNKKGTRTHFTTRRPASEGRAEKVEYGRREGGYRPHREDFSTSRSFDSEDKPQRSYGARPARPQGERRPYGDRPQGERRPYGDRPQGERRTYGDRPQGEHRSYGERPQGDRPYGERKAYGSKPYGDTPRKSGYGKPSFGPKPAGPGRGRKPAPKRSEADAGMSAMLSRKPQVSGSAWSDDDTSMTLCLGYTPAGQMQIYEKNSTVVRTFPALSCGFRQDKTVSLSCLNRTEFPWTFSKG